MNKLEQQSTITTALDGKLVDLLVITDQEGSSKLSVAETKNLAPIHFHLFLSALARLRAQGAETYLVKNIGDSLMIRIRCTNEEVPGVLAEILQAQDLATKQKLITGNLAVRVAIFLLNSEIMVEGDKMATAAREEVAATLREESDAVPPKRWKGDTKGDTWLSGDLFGPSINIAFRGSHVSSSTLTIVEDAIAKIVWEQIEPTRRFSSGPFPAPLNSSLHAFFGESLPFSPLKGFENLFGNPLEEIGWRGHLFLRAVTPSTSTGMKRAQELVLEQQKFRVWGRMLWDGDGDTFLPSPPQVKEWCDKLYKMAGETTYLRSVSAALAQHHIIFPNPEDQGKTPDQTIVSPADQTNDAQSRDSVQAEQFYNGYLPAGFVFSFASPSEAAFNLFRQALEKKQTKGEGFICALSTLVYSPSTNVDEGTEDFWPDPVKSCDKFVLLFARWIDRNRNDHADSLTGALRQKVRIQRPEIGLRAATWGRTIGGEWDVYVCLVPSTGADITSNAFQTLVTALRAKLFDKEVYAMAAYLCDQSTFKSLREMKNGTASPDHLSAPV
jgi:hypothetical protein